MNYIRTFTIFSLFLFLLACSQKGSDQASQTISKELLTSGFFDLEKFVKDLKDQPMDEELIQYIEINGESEILNKKQEDLDEFLDMVSKSNINNSSLFDKYQVDTSSSEDGQIITYTSLDEGLKVQKLVVQILADASKNVKITEEFSSLISESGREIEFLPQGIIRLNKQTENRLEEDQELHIYWYLNKLAFEEDQQKRLE